MVRQKHGNGRVGILHMLTPKMHCVELLEDVNVPELTEKCLTVN